MSIALLSRVALGSLLAYEGVCAVERFNNRVNVFGLAKERARAIGRPLLVVGAPEAGIHTRLFPAYDCGDLCVDINGCGTCPHQAMIDVTKPIPLASDSMVVYESCVLECCDDPVAAWNELARVAGSPENHFHVRVQPGTLTSRLYPGCKWTTVDTEPKEVDPLPTLGALGLLTFGSFL